jgi:hypothetical protein
MTRPTTPDGAEVQLIYAWEGQSCENVLHFHGPVDWDAAALTTLAVDVTTWWEANLAPLTSDAVSLVEVVATDLSSASGPQIVSTAALPLLGTDHSGTQPNNVTVAIKQLTASRGRSFRGRTYFVGLSLNEVVASFLAGGVAADLVTAFRALRDFTFGVAGTEWGVLSEITAGAPRANGIITPITDVAVEGTTDSQRRRLPGRGR